MASCVIIPNVKNNNGEIVESKLFKDLWQYTGSRSEAKKYYALSKTEEFTSKYKDEIQYDDNGEVTFKSLNKIVDIKNDDSKTLSNLNKEIKSGEYSFADAVSKMQSFNKNSQFTDKYMATIKMSNKSDTFNLEVVKRSGDEESKLEDLMRKRNLKERIIYRLNSVGASVSFVQNDEFRGRYNTENADKTADGLIGVIEVADNKENIEDTIAEEAGHFAIGALGENNPLVTRLMDVLTQDVIDSLIEQYGREEFYSGSNIKRELAGKLVGEYIKKSVDLEPKFKPILRRIVWAIKNLFAKLTKNTILQDKIMAERIAERIAKGFMSPDFTGTIENALDTHETLFSKKAKNTSTTAETFQKLAANVTNLKRSLQSQGFIDSSLMDNAYKNSVTGIAKEIEKLDKVVAECMSKIYTQGNNTLSNNEILKSVALLYSVVSDMFTTGNIQNLLNSVDFTDKHDFHQNLVKNASALRTVGNCLKYISQIDFLVSSALNPEGVNTTTGIPNDIIVDNEHVNLKDIHKEILVAANESLMKLQNKQLEFFAIFAEDIYGKQYIDASTRAVFKRGRLVSEKLNNTTINGKDLYSISKAVSYVEDDINIFERVINSMSNNSDIICQLADRACKECNKVADDSTEEDWMELRRLYQEFNNLKDKNGRHPKITKFIEKDRNGHYTHNFVSPLKLGDWEEDFRKAKVEWENEFKEKYPDYKSWDSFTKGLYYSEFVKYKYKEFHKGVDKNGNKVGEAHSKKNAITGKYGPNPEFYTNNAYDELSEEEKAWLNKMIALKQKMDERLPEGATTTLRLPQFKARFVNRIQNMTYNGQNRFKALGKSLLAGIRDTFCESSVDTDYGCDLFYMKDDDIGNDVYYQSLEKMNRVPMYGINKLVNKEGIPSTDEMSTDIFGSMLAYSAMTNNYQSMNTVVDMFEVIKDSMYKSRRVGGATAEYKKGKQGIYNRFVKYIDKQVYGINSQLSWIKSKHGSRIGIQIGKNRLLFDKVLKASSAYAAKRFLGGNLHGALVNTGTGCVEILKEAMAGEFFTMSDLLKADKLYLKYCVPCFIADFTGDQMPNNKLALMHRRWNITGKNDEIYKDWNTTVANRIHRANPLGGNLFLAYSSGDHYMQSMSYLALALKTKVYNVDGEEISLWDAYKPVDASEERDPIIHDAFDRIGTIALANNEKEYVIEKRIINKIDTAIRLNTSPDFSREDEAFMSKYGIPENDLFKALDMVNEKFEENTRFFKSQKAKKLYEIYEALINHLENYDGNLSDEEEYIVKTLRYDKNGNPEYTKSMLNTKLYKDNLINDLKLEQVKQTYTVSDESAFMDKCRDINNRMHGIYNKQDKSALQDNIFGSFLMSMRGYALGYLENNFGVNKYRISKEGYQEGKWMTFLKVACSMSPTNNVGGFGLALHALFAPWIAQETLKRNMVAAGFGEHQFYSIKRWNQQILLLAIMLVSAALVMNTLKGGGDDDDDDFNPDEDMHTLALLAYFLSRIDREQAAYTPGAGFFVTGGMEDEWMNVVSLTGAGMSALLSDYSLLEKWITTDVDDFESTLKYTKNTKKKYKSRSGYERAVEADKQKKYEKKMDGLWQRFLNSLPYIKSYNVWNHPFKSLEGFEYQRKLKPGAR